MLTISLLGLAVATIAAVAVYIFLFIFLHGSIPGGKGNQKQDKFIDETCSPSGLLKTVITWGYAKATWRRFAQYYRLILFPQPQAKMGAKAPDAKLVRLDGTNCNLLEDYVAKMEPGMPLILNMGSFTWPPFACNTNAMMSIYDSYCSGEKCDARFLTIYIEEAHADDEWKLPESKVETEMNTSIPVHKNINDRIAAACMLQAKRKIPQLDLVCDSMEGNIADRYGAWPERLYIIVDGVVVYKGGIGPFEYKLWEVQEWLAERYGKRGASLRK